MLSCKDATRLVSEHLDRKLPFWRRAGLRLHVLLCRGCSRYTQQIKKIDQAVSSHYRADPASRTRERISDSARERIKASLCSTPSDGDSQRDE